MQILKRYGAFVLLGVLGAAVVLYGASKYGVGLTPDSVQYIQIARGIVAGEGIPSRFTLQPPLYPLALAVGALLTRMDAVDAAVWLNALWFAGTIFLAGVALARHLRGFPLLAVVGTLCVLVARPLVNVAVTAYSEMLFIFLMLAAFVGLELYFEKRAWKWFGVAVVATALACLTRYVGVALVGSGALAIVWVLRGERVRAAGLAALFAGLSALPLGGWMVRNLLVSGEPFGARAASRVTLLENVNLAAGTFLNWFVGDAWVGVFWIVLAVVGAVFVWRVVKGQSQRTTRENITVAPYAWFVLLFSALLIFSATTTAYNRINTRLLSPLFVPALVLMVVMMDGAANVLRGRMDRRVVDGGLVVVVALLGLSSLQSNLPRLQRAAEQGAGGYNTTRWRTSETVAYVAEQGGQLEGALYSNGPDALYILANVKAESVLPKYEYASNERAFDAGELRGTYPPATGTLVWLDNVERDDFLFTLDEIKEFTTLTPLVELSDGKVYRMERRAK